MQNFAQEFPFLLFLPVVIFAGLAVLVGIIHLATLFEASIVAQRRMAASAARGARPATRQLEPQLSSRLGVSPPPLRLISRKVWPV